MIEHHPWLPTKRGGINGMRIAIVGYSHHRKEGTADSAEFTLDVIRAVIAGDLKTDSFFPRVRRYFDYSDAADFWRRVIFFNFLPDCVGSSAQKYGPGTREQIDRGRKRFSRLMAEHIPEKVFVFTTKGWNACPDTDDEPKRINPRTALPSWGTYTFGRRKILACGFRHPQYANTEQTRAHVQRFLSM